MSLSPIILGDSDSKRGTVAVIDSGVGGLSVLRELRPMLPLNSILYYADSANCPYGGRTMEEIVELTKRVVRLVVERGARVVVLACNTMTAAAIDTLRNEWTEVDFVGMEPAIKPAVEITKSGVVGVLATKATLSGNLYHSTKVRYAGDVDVVEIAGVGLVEFIERGEQNSVECRELLRGYIMEMVGKKCDTVVLGCSHYPFLKESIEGILREMGVVMNIINPAPAVAFQARKVVEMSRVKEGDGGDVATYYFSSGQHNVGMQRIIESLW